MIEWMQSTNKLKEHGSSKWTDVELTSLIVKNRSHPMFHDLIDQNRNLPFADCLKMLQKTCDSKPTMKMLWIREWRNNSNSFCLFSDVKAFLQFLRDRDQELEKHWHLMILAQLPQPLQSFARKQTLEGQQPSIEKTLKELETYLKMTGATLLSLN